MAKGIPIDDRGLPKTITPKEKLVINMDNFAEEFQKLNDDEVKMMRKAISCNTVKRNVEIWTRNFRNNTYAMILDPEKNRSVQEIKRMPNRPTVCVGAGPSLMKNIRLLKKFKKMDGLIITSDKCLRDVCKYVVPDYVVHADSNPVNVKFYEDVPLTEDTHAIFAAVSDPKISKYIKGKIYWFNAQIPNDIFPNAAQFMQLVNGRPNVSFGGNIGSLAWLMARFLACDPVALIGYDMSWDKDCPKNWMMDQKGNPLYYKHDNVDSGYEYKKDKTGERIWNKSVFEVNGFPGCYTDPVFWNYRGALLERLRVERHTKAATTINCTEGGILYENGGSFPIPMVDEKGKMILEEVKAEEPCSRCGVIKEVTNKAMKMENVTIDKLPSMSFKRFILECKRGTFKKGDNNGKNITHL